MKSVPLAQDGQILGYREHHGVGVFKYANKCKHKRFCSSQVCSLKGSTIGRGVSPWDYVVGSSKLVKSIVIRKRQEQE